MKKRYIFFAIIAIYLAIVVVAFIFAANKKSESEENTTPTATATEAVTPTPTAEKTQCENDRDTIQAAINAYHKDHGNWPTADGKPGDIVWDKLAPAYMSPGVDDQCDWQVSSSPAGQVCAAHMC